MQNMNPRNKFVKACCCRWLPGSSQPRFMVIPLSLQVCLEKLESLCGTRLPLTWPTVRCRSIVGGVSGTRWEHRGLGCLYLRETFDRPCLLVDCWGGDTAWSQLASLSRTAATTGMAEPVSPCGPVS